MSEPVDLSERSIQNLTSGIVAGLNGRNTPAPPPGGGSGAGRSNDTELSRLFTGVNNLATSVGMLTQGTYGLAQASGDISKVIGLFGTAGAGIAQFGQSVVGVALDTNKYMMDVSKSGFTFDQNLGLFSQSVLGAHMSLPGFKKFIDEAGKSLGGLSGTATNSALAYLKMLQEINENSSVYKMKVAGLDDFDKALALSASMNRSSSMQDDRSKKMVIDSAVQMAVEMDNIARLTGKSRQEQQKAIETQMKKDEMEIALLAMTEEERAAYEDNIAVMGKYGKGFQDQMTELTVGQGNVVSEKGTKLAAALDTMAPGLTALMSKAATETDAVRRKQLQDEIDVRMARLAQDKNALREIAIITAQGKSDVGTATGSLIAGSKEYLLVLEKATKEGKAQGLTELQIIENAKAKFAEDRNKKPDTPGYDPNKAASGIINQGEILLKQVSSGFGETLAGMNTKIGTSITQFDGLNTALTNRTQSELAVTELLNKFKAELGITSVAVNKDNVSSRFKDNVPAATPGKALGDEFIPAGWAGLVGEKGPEFLQVGAQSSIKSNTVSMGLLDQAVTKLPAMMSGMQNELKLAMHEAKNSMPSAKDFDSLFSNFKTTFSSQVAPEDQKYQQASAMPSDASSALQKGIDMLNTSVKQLITAVEDGTYKSVKAVKSTGNMLA